MVLNLNLQRLKLNFRQRLKYYWRHYFKKIQKHLLILGWANFADHKVSDLNLPKFEFAKFDGKPLVLKDFQNKVANDNGNHVDLFNLADSRESIFDTAQECFYEKGFWPISLSSPQLCDSEPILNRSQMISSVVPGLPYSFENADDYYKEYKTSYYALTHKKGGWDCYRHIEILLNGSIPLMPDAFQIPKFSMVHYPKSTLKAVAEKSNDVIQIPGVWTRANLKDYFNENLTSRAMANYILRCAGLTNVEKILFIDHRLPFSPDHFSFLSLIGLKQEFGKSCVAMQPVNYLYENWKGDASHMFGRGFGYVRCLPVGVSDSHRLIMSLKSVAKKLKKQEYDLVVFGSIMRNLMIFEELKPYLDPTRTIVINGEDLPPSEEALNYMRDTRCHVFVRSIE